jgi:prepilin-type N-terminal cleavage/methylation domain-containing protein
VQSDTYDRYRAVAPGLRRWSAVMTKPSGHSPEALHGSSSRGYSLVELLVVVAIIGIFSLVSVPPMMAYMNQIKVRSATRQLNTDLRFARQRAISRGNPVAFSFLPGNATTQRNVEKAQYGFYDRGTLIPATDPPRYNWVQVGPLRYLEGVYFLRSTFPLNSAIDDGQHDIIFRPNGTVDNTPVGNVEIRTERDLTNNHVTDRFSVSGSFTTVLTTD